MKIDSRYGVDLSGVLLIMGNLHQAAKCASDGFDQSFGIPSTLPRPWGVKQGWSGFGAGPAPGEECAESSQVQAVLASSEVGDAVARFTDLTRDVHAASSAA